MDTFAKAAPEIFTETLKRRYRDVMPARIQALESAYDIEANDRTAACAAIRGLAHGLRGSGGTYGFPEVTRAAAALEEADEQRFEHAFRELIATLEGVAAADASAATVLVVETHACMRELLAGCLAAPQRRILMAASIAEAEAELQANHVDLVLLGLNLPDGDGRELLAALRVRHRTTGIPVIVLGSQITAPTKTECFALGADMLFEYPFDPEIVSAAVAAKLDQAGRAARESRLDSVTELPNRAAFREQFDRAAAQATRSCEPLSVGILELDDFCSINDTYGPEVGDEVLRACAHLIATSLRKADLLARWDGAEFVALLPNANAEGGAEALRNALDTVRAAEFPAPGGQSVRVTYSAGVADVLDCATADEAIAKADFLLHVARSRGRDQVIATTDRSRAAGRRVLLAEDDELVASVIKHRLGLEGLEVLHLAAGDAALEAAKTIPVDLVILDVRMPGMDGFDVLRELHRVPFLARIPVIMLTSIASDEDIVRGFELGASDYIVKPFSPMELLARVRRLLPRS